MTIMTAEGARVTAFRDKFGTRDAILSDARAESLRDMIDAGLSPRMNAKWNQVLSRSADYTPVGPLDPWGIPNYYTHPGESAAATAIVRADAETAVDLGFRYKVTGDEYDARAVARILDAWSVLTFDANSTDDKLGWSDKWPMFLQAAMLINDSPHYTSVLDGALSDLTREGLAYSSSLGSSNNVAAWGTAFEICCAAFLRDRALFDSALHRWRFIFDTMVVDNTPWNEIYRQAGSWGDGSTGLHYSNFFVNALTQGAEWARFNGEWLYDHVGPDGSTLKGLWDKVAGWTRRPDLYPYNSASTPSETVRIQAHVDVLHALWPSEDSQYLIDTYTTTQDYYGFRGSVLAYRGRPLYG